MITLGGNEPVMQDDGHVFHHLSMTNDLIDDRCREPKRIENSEQRKEKRKQSIGKRRNDIGRRAQSQEHLLEQGTEQR